MTPSLVLIICYGSQNSGKHFTYYYRFFIMDANEKPDDKVQNGPEHMNLCLRSLGFPDVFTNLEVPQSFHGISIIA